MKVLMQLNDLANWCGHFYNAHFDDLAKSCPNNGYNCRHPKQGEVYEGVGCCFSWSCPLENAYEADEEDCAKYGFEYEESEYMIVEIEESQYNEHIMNKREKVENGMD